MGNPQTPTVDQLELLDEGLTDFLATTYEAAFPTNFIRILVDDTRYERSSAGWDQYVRARVNFKQFVPVEDISEALTNADLTAFIGDVVKPLGPPFTATRSMRYDVEF